MPKRYANMHDALKTVFGHDDFRPGQEDVIDTILSGQNVLAVMPTGAGKSLCYQVPSLLLDGTTVVVSPLVALMDNQVAALRANGVAVSCIHSGQDRARNVEEWKRVSRGEADMLYLSPERLMTDRMLSAMAQIQPPLFVVDEAHCVSKWGPAFRPEYAQLSQLKSLFPNARVAAFTATADEGTRVDIAAQLFGGNGRMIVQGFDRPNLSLTVQPKVNRSAQLIDFMKGREGESGIVYALSRKNTEEHARALVAEGYTALPYHAGMPADVRFENQERFIAEDGIVMVATIAFGMGIDKPDIRFVYHVNLPSSLEAYYQEIGRAGRDGNPADTVLLYGLDDIRMRRQFITQEDSDQDHQLREHKRLDALLGYCEASTCRRQVLMAYFGETIPPCGSCDVCENPPDRIDATDAAIALFQAVQDTGERFGANHVIAVARGAETEKIRQFGHDQLPSHGTGERWGDGFFKSLVRQAIATGYLQVDMQRYGRLVVTDAGRKLVSGEGAFLMTEPKAPKPKRDRKRKVAPDLLDQADQELLAKLKGLRRDMARALGKPAFIIFSDATLIDMAQKRPLDRAQMLSVSGVGETKFERFGEAFLDAIN
ncbi:ATP-dependent DNA helicase RecQ [Algimonas ampicilliniresistens]|jgi:ATP-dependent DNA helicase RecQ|uniref:DNA helicase RecQ n=1 Tax=Algimonas ampicilliniresistens TaxID=1298735 RepID=A0ABQ5V8Y5_9PROT|nr:DNA helicase RecQ [Algimonas ampicilliniresistens]GLQ23502.1 ATP-dependent DNA helicase RecQ [Algimonas ampicilliniresistens]